MICLRFRLQMLVMCLLGWLALFSPVSYAQQDQGLVFPMLLKKKERDAGNPLATYAAMRELESQYLQSKMFAGFYPEVKCNFEEFLGFPFAGEQAMSLPMYKRKAPSVEAPIPDSYRPEDALSVLMREAQKTRVVILAEEHHLPQSRSLNEAILTELWKQGYRYFAAETFADKVMEGGFQYPDYQSGVYLLDPIFASAVRLAKKLGYTLIAYEPNQLGPTGAKSFRDSAGAEHIKARIFDKDPQAKVFIVAGRLHASEHVAPDGWTPMASVLKKITGINPFTLYAPTMSQRQTREEENPQYLFATSRGLVKEPTIFVNPSDGSFLGFENYCDAYIFWPRVEVQQGRPNWMKTLPGRKRVEIPTHFTDGEGMRLIQAFPEGEPASSIPSDQFVLEGNQDHKVLFLTPGQYWLRAVDKDSQVLAQSVLIVE